MTISKSHALISGLTGAAFAVGGLDALVWIGWYKVLLGLLLSTIFGVFGGWFIAFMIQVFFARSSPSISRRTFSRLQIVSSAFMAFSHGSNDGQKFIGIFTLALLIGGTISEFHVSFWVIVTCAAVMGLGTSIGGLRIIKTLGYRMFPMETYQGFSAETAAATIITFASAFGIPLSTTHTIGTAIVGVGLASHTKKVHWNVVSHIIFGWILTFPACALVAYVSALIYQSFSYVGLGIFIALLMLVIYLMETGLSRVKNVSKA